MTTLPAVGVAPTIPCLQAAATAHLAKLQSPAPGTVCKDAPLRFGP